MLHLEEGKEERHELRYLLWQKSREGNSRARSPGMKHPATHYLGCVPDQEEYAYERSGRVIVRER